ncbi:hypothetical protein M1N61_01590 [Peptococcaceae bacterium]|nr:hypothetical protein [Peptococcaceae bacterium]
MKGVERSLLGMKVKKSGRTTGITTGIIRIIGTSLKVEMGREIVLFNEQIISDLKSRGGDSGSLVLSMDNKAVGLFFAGSDRVSVFNGIQEVLEKLDVDFYKH